MTEPNLAESSDPDVQALLARRETHRLNIAAAEKAGADAKALLEHAKAAAEAQA
jgi:hypothetical protein